MNSLEKTIQDMIGRLKEDIDMTETEITYRKGEIEALNRTIVRLRAVLEKIQEGKTEE